MKGTNLGEFEEIVLLTIAVLVSEAYSVAICDELTTRTARGVRLGVVHSVLHRLEKKGYVRSMLGEPTKARGGRRKRFYELTTAGSAAINTAKEIRDQYWKMIPKAAIAEAK